MISNQQMMELLLQACPSFAPTWKDWLAEWSDSEGELPYYLAMTEFARHLTGMLSRGQTQDFPVIFEVVEKLVVDGDEYVKGAAIVGLLEDLQNLNLHQGTKPEQLVPYLGPESAQAWDELIRFWRQTEKASAAGILYMAPEERARLKPESFTDPELREIVEQMQRKMASEKQSKRERE